MTIKGLIRREN